MASANDFNARIIEEFRSSGGQLGGDRAGSPLLLLSTTGAKSGERRVNPMMDLADGDRLLVFASRAGAPTNPDWYHNLVANPNVTVEVGSETYEATASVLTGDERDRLYARQAERYPVFAEYAKKTPRTIPVVALARKGQGTAYHTRRHAMYGMFLGRSGSANRPQLTHGARYANGKRPRPLA